MTNEDIPNLPEYNDSALDQAFAALAEQVTDEAAAIAGEADLEAFRLRWVGRKQGRLNEVSARWLKAAPPAAQKSRRRALQDAEGTGRRADRQSRPAPVPAMRHSPPRPSTSRCPARAASRAQSIPSRARSTRSSRSSRLSDIPSALAPKLKPTFTTSSRMNFPPGHPARDTQDTLVDCEPGAPPLRDRLLLRTHTSPVQMRTMEQQPPPVRIVIPGKVHRNDAADATHSPIFHQVEGLCVDTNITFSDLKGTLDHAMKALFGSSVKTRFFPSFFPFTEPSADVQISCIFCGGKGCRKCKHSGWIELLGCGMVDPAVFAFAAEKQPAYDPKKISGFAFGMGVERIAMMKYGISEIGQFYAGDMRFLGQFASSKLARVRALQRKLAELGRDDAGTTDIIEI